MHRSRLCYVVVDCADLDAAVRFWAAALGGEEEWIGDASRHIYRRITVSGSGLRVLLQKVPEPKTVKSRMHVDIESDDIDAEKDRLVALGATVVREEVERGFRFWVLTDPFDNEFCVINTEYPHLLATDGAVW